MNEKTANRSARNETAKPSGRVDEIPAEVLVGRRLHTLRAEKGLSLRAMAERSGLNINTLSLVEHGKCSPSVSTLQQIARALDVPIGVFFEVEPSTQSVVFTPADQRPEVTFNTACMQNLAQNLAGNTIQPFVVKLQPGAGSGEQWIVHTGHEFVYCLTGTVDYQVGEERFLLTPGDSLVFEAHLPHRWKNEGLDETRILLLLCPADRSEQPGCRHFPIE